MCNYKLKGGSKAPLGDKDRKVTLKYLDEIQKHEGRPTSNQRREAKAKAKKSFPLSRAMHKSIANPRPMVLATKLQDKPTEALGYVLTGRVLETLKKKGWAK